MTTPTDTSRGHTSEFAIASLTLGIVTFINLLGLERALLAIVFGVLALRRIKADERLTGKGLAVSGIVLGVIGAIVLPALAVMYLPQILPRLGSLGEATVILEDHPGPAGATEQTSKSAAACEAAAAWLQLVDAGQYAEAWETSASVNQKAIGRDEMVEKYESFRPALGQVASRELKSADYTTSLPNAPPGEYVVIEFNTVFDNNRRFLERITPMLDTDGQWKVSGYYVLN